MNNNQIEGSRKIHRDIIALRAFEVATALGVALTIGLALLLKNPTYFISSLGFFISGAIVQNKIDKKRSNLSNKSIIT